ncbi:MAG: DUF481 domain-containing protein [Cellvibrionaceae bacterium]
MSVICRTLKVVILLGGFLTSVVPAISFAAEQSDNRVNIYLSAYRPKIDTSIRLDSEALDFGTVINLEDSTALEDRKTLGALSVSYRMSKKFWLDFSHFELSRSGSRRLEGEIRFGEEQFEVDELIETQFNVDITRLGIGYAFYNTSDLSVSITSGLHVTQFEVGIAATGREAEESAEETAPLPYVGIGLDYRISNSWSVGGQAEFFGIELNDVDGALTNATFALGYKFSRHLSFGAGYNYYQLKVSSDSLADGLSGEFEYTYGGPLVFVRLGF